MESIEGKKLNKGEWAEFYVLLKLLGDGRLYTADKLLKKNLQNYLDIVRIIRQEFDSTLLDYIVDQDSHQVRIECQGEQLTEFSMNDFRRNADLLFNGIKDLKGNSVPAPDSVCKFAKMIYVSKPKAPSVESLKKQFGGKNDIYIEVRDSTTSIVSVMGFSIKSKFAQPPTLFNAGTSSQLIFEVGNCSDQKMEEFNNISDSQGRGWSKCRNYLISNNMKLDFVHAANPIYDDNMFLIRESMSKIMAWCMADRLVNSVKNFQVKETTERMILENPLQVPNPQLYYEKAIKDFLMAGFTGMTAGRKWDGREQVSGGYIVVLEDGEVVCYHSADRESFRDYLYQNTFFEYVSAHKFKWSYLYKKEGKYYLPLNFSIRFNTQTR